MKSLWQQHAYALALLACLLVGGALGWQLTRPTASPTLTPRQQREDKQAAAAAQQAAATTDATGDSAVMHAAIPYRAAQAAETHALTLHAQSHALRRPLRARVDSSAAAVDSLTRFLATY